MAGGGQDPVDASTTSHRADGRGGRPGGRRRGRQRERGSMVPAAEFSSYYGRPILKKPTWKSPDVPVYLWVGGLAGTSAVVAALG
ncbi:MAG: polysulfide reductase, partial [Pseudonocardiaceae bacterium]